MKKIFVILSLASALMLPAAADGGIEFSGTVESVWGVAAPWTDSDTAGKFTLGTTSFNGELEAFYGNSSAYAQADISYDACGALNGTDGSGNIGNGLNISLGELWVDYTESFWGIRIGRQKAAWGKADGIDITNVICPSDMSSFSAMTSDDSKLAIDAMRLSFSGDQFTADAYWIPFFTPSALPLDEGNMLRKFIIPSDSPYTITLGEIDTPQTAIWNGEYGIKLSGYFSAFDVSLYGFYGWDDMPFLDYAPTSSTSITINGDYSHMGMIGADAALPIKEIVLRLETAFFPQRHFQKSSQKIIAEKMSGIISPDITEQHNELSGLVGVDWMPSGWTITAQYFCDAVFGDLDALEREDAFTHGASLSISKSLVNETLDLSLSGLVNFNDFDSLISPSVSYSVSDQIKIEGGAYIFLPGPDSDGEYGKYKDLSTIFIKARFSF